MERCSGDNLGPRVVKAELSDCRNFFPALNGLERRERIFSLSFGGCFFCGFGFGLPFFFDCCGLFLLLLFLFLREFPFDFAFCRLSPLFPSPPLASNLSSCRQENVVERIRRWLWIVGNIKASAQKRFMLIKLVPSATNKSFVFICAAEVALYINRRFMVFFSSSR